MKRITLLMIIGLFLFSCSKRNKDTCIIADKTTVAVDETITISNCGDDIPSNYVKREIDWGDGNVSSGQTGTHKYTSTGTYEIRLILNDEFNSNDSDLSKVQINIIVE